MTTSRLPVALLVLALTGCHKSSSPSGVVCTALAAAGLGVSLSDSVSGATTGFTNVSVVARDGAYKDSVFAATFPPPFGNVIALAYEHRGTVQVTVRADGYAPWVKNGIVITGDECHVTQVNVSARLIR